jgi:transcriptional regulator with XRE-family HTH domain
MKGRPLGQLIRFYRKKAGLTQEELGDGVGAKNTYISRVENGHVMPSESEVRAIALELGEKPGYFLDRLKEETDGAPDTEDNGDGDSGEPSRPATRSDDAEEQNDGTEDMPPWEREDGWERCERKSSRGLGTEQVTIRADGGVYLSAALARAAGLEPGHVISMWKKDGAGGIESDPVGGYTLSNEGDDSGVKVSGTHFRAWSDDGCIRAPVTGYGDGWIAFERPEA